LFLRIGHTRINRHDLFEVSMAVTAVAALFHYNYQRRIQIAGRYYLFWAVSQYEEESDTPAQESNTSVQPQK
jgi:hypothetical protein